jgi:hypothetical protein
MSLQARLYFSPYRGFQKCCCRLEYNSALAEDSKMSHCREKALQVIAKMSLQGGIYFSPSRGKSLEAFSK